MNSASQYKYNRCVGMLREVVMEGFWGEGGCKYRASFISGLESWGKSL